MPESTSRFSSRYRMRIQEDEDVSVLSGQRVVRLGVVIFVVHCDLSLILFQTPGELAGELIFQFLSENKKAPVNCLS